jgi:hypothetical protein
MSETYPLYMTSTLQLNLSQHLNADELRELTEESLETNKPIERVLFESAKELVRRRREGRLTTQKAA